MLSAARSLETIISVISLMRACLSLVMSDRESGTVFLERTHSRLTRRHPLFDLAFKADSKDSQRMIRWTKLVLAGDLILFVLDNLAVKLDQSAAVCTDQVVVMLVIVEVLISSSAIAKPLFASKPALGKKLERAINSCRSNVRGPCFDLFLIHISEPT